uniref:Glycos_transf_1 domain-containing protein n=1 Tax=Heligmosomoides polygyrus TaxID=6339 RepID=A0A183GJX2_HELPZ
LLRNSRAVLYTPHNEHFGIVPVEAMYLGTPVIAVNSGGPKESIAHGRTGFLAEQKPEEFAKHMMTLMRNAELRRKFGE